jgi:hypothetical protein
MNPKTLLRSEITRSTKFSTLLVPKVIYEGLVNLYSLKEEVFSEKEKKENQVRVARLTEKNFGFPGFIKFHCNTTSTGFIAFYSKSKNHKHLNDAVCLLRCFGIKDEESERIQPLKFEGDFSACGEYSKVTEEFADWVLMKAHEIFRNEHLIVPQIFWLKQHNNTNSRS